MKFSSMTELLDRVEEIVREAGALLMDHVLAAHVHEKGKTDFVTDADTAVQALIQKRLYALDDSIQFMGEEKDNADIVRGEPVWILDPVDGTTNLIHHFQHSAISLALAKGGDVLLGVIYNPFSGEMCTATLGGGARMNGKPIHVSDAKTLADSLCSAGTNPGRRDQADAAFARMRALYERCQDIRRIGAASVELCYIACGRLDGYVEHGLRPWDFAAGKLIIEEAGGKVTGYAGAPLDLYADRSDVLATNGRIHDEMISLM